MHEQGRSQRGFRFLISAAALVIIIMGINQAQSVLVSFLFAVFLAVLGTPPVLWLERKRVPSLVAVLITVTMYLMGSCLSPSGTEGDRRWRETLMRRHWKTTDETNANAPPRRPCAKANARLYHCSVLCSEC
jgi:hypothetical protein